MKKAWVGIVKVQRELAPNRDGTFLVTSARGAIHYAQPMSPEILAWLGDEFKKFCHATLDGDGVIHIKTDHTVGDQGW